MECPSCQSASGFRGEQSLDAEGKPQGPERIICESCGAEVKLEAKSEKKDGDAILAKPPTRPLKNASAPKLDSDKKEG